MSEIKRRYCSKSELNVHLVLEDGKNMIVDFKGKDVIKKEYFVDVKDPLIWKALESNKFFGVYFEKSNEYDWMEAALKQVIPPTPVVDAQPTETEETETVENAPVVEETPVEETTTETVEVPETPVIEEAPVISTEETPETVTETIVTEEVNEQVVEKEFPSGKEAKEWLNKTFNVPYNKMPNNELTAKEFSALGMTLVLTNKN